MTAPTLHDAPVFGWDVGGAHVKVSMATRAGVLADVAQWACPLWQGMAHLERAIDAMFERWPAAADPAARHAVTMTGEMVDLFADRAEGVRALTRALAQRLGPRTMFFAGDAGWLARSACAEHWRKVASANWLATAQWVAACLPDALLVDIGSTTTDIIPIVGRRVVARGTSDAERLVSGELVYQGVVRTPLCGLAHRIAFRGEHAGVMNEWFATTADVYRLTGELWPEHDQHPSADNGPKTQAASRVRIARMIGRDAADASDAEWRRFAQGWRREQLRALETNLARVVAQDAALAAAPIVGAGCGRFLAAALARQEARSYVDFARLAGIDGDDATRAEWVSTCAPSVAVALLASMAMKGAGGNEAHLSNDASARAA
ncbi:MULTISPECIES: hydantoinase/oxoprolinase family protein [Caballeronia]|jgi:probable H4MPT-linked C1 transfer pathway protein|uniref:H4MPT-linked C1 transfer pathway protein n=1 Tax=Caballeronia zhejiangensis TaxID=871203 RepID=A0A656QDQ5_9BURK|nr:MULTISPECIES: hydantoinase/oxoprolinase family protein [Caballeronia]EKS67406.1 tetrahydromethanopterin biosynthesis protein hydrolase [Burkholderia sp. SJ98]KDR25153.1 H4MPT-linked C1 transfer pathway protein [Caballeronia zhejiangensis]MDR5789309.1 hydantoinase/oxoprolinase family protein [Caballeronia sp. LP003]